MGPGYRYRIPGRVPQVHGREPLLFDWNLMRYGRKAHSAQHSRSQRRGRTNPILSSMVTLARTCSRSHRTGSPQVRKSRGVVDPRDAVPVVHPNPLDTALVGCGRLRDVGLVTVEPTVRSGRVDDVERVAVRRALGVLGFDSGRDGPKSNGRGGKGR